MRCTFGLACVLTAVFVLWCVLAAGGVALAQTQCQVHYSGCNCEPCQCETENICGLGRCGVEGCPCEGWWPCESEPGTWCGGEAIQCNCTGEGCPKGEGGICPNMCRRATCRAVSLYPAIATKKRAVMRGAPTRARATMRARPRCTSATRSRARTTGATTRAATGRRAATSVPRSSRPHGTAGVINVSASVVGCGARTIAARAGV